MEEQAVAKPRVLMVHAHYQQRGGEDAVFEAEAGLLQHRGHHVVRLTRHNSDVDSQRRWTNASAAVWNREAAAEVSDRVRRDDIDVVHVHNEFPTFSPSIFSAARQAGAAVVKTLHNARPLCPKAVRFRDGQSCEACIGHSVAWSGIRHACYRDSRLATAVVSLSSLVHRYAKTFAESVDVCIAPTHHVRKTFLDSGYPIGQIMVKPHFIEEDLGVGGGRGGYVMYAGRLSVEKGIGVLLSAWKRLEKAPELRVVGDGPLVDQVRAAGPTVRWMGHLPKHEVYQQMGDAACFILPSGCQETFGRVAVEAYSRATPVICADLGGQAEVVTDPAMRFRPGNDEDLAEVVRRFFASPDGWDSKRRAARELFLQRYTAAINYEQLIDVYEEALRRRGRNHPPSGGSPTSLRRRGEGRFGKRGKPLDRLRPLPETPLPRAAFLEFDPRQGG